MNAPSRVKYTKCPRTFGEYCSYLVMYLFSFSCLCVMVTGLLCTSMLPVVSFCFRMFCKYANKKRI